MALRASLRRWCGRWSVDRTEASLGAIKAVCRGVLDDPARWSSDTVILAKALLALTHDLDRLTMYSKEDDNAPEDGRHD